jgi:hypothetical protein
MVRTSARMHGTLHYHTLRTNNFDLLASSFNKIFSDVRKISFG